MSLIDKIKNIAMEELKAKGYAPNPADVSGIAVRVNMLVEHEIEVAKSVLSLSPASQVTQATAKVDNPPKP